MKRVRFTAAARHELLAQTAWYSQADPALGARFSAAVEAATLRALAFPAAGCDRIPTHVFQTTVESRTCRDSGLSLSGRM